MQRFEEGEEEIEGETLIVLIESSYEETIEALLDSLRL